MIISPQYWTSFIIVVPYINTLTTILDVNPTEASKVPEKHMFYKEQIYVH